MATDADNKIAATFDVPHRRYLDETGAAQGSLPDFAASRDALATLYRWMVLTRVFDEKAVALQRTGRLGTFASSLGQEAVGVGVASAMLPGDVLVPSFREQGAMFVRGVTMLELLLYWGGLERGSDFAGPREDFPISVPVGTQFPHAAGIAMAFQLRREPRAAVAVGGDGSTSKGDFYEAMNMAGVWRLPVVFVINNNQWAISVPRAQQSAARTLAQKGIAAGIACEQVDGNDVIAVREAVTRALDQARSGGGPTLIEAVTYRLSDHTTADDARRYRSNEEVSSQWHGEPIARLRAYLVSAFGWEKAAERGVHDSCRAEVEAAVADYLDAATPDAREMFDYLHDVLPPALAAQRAEVLAHAGGDDA